MNTPVIFLVFNRPELTERVFARIREARPRQLYIICDGPRLAVPEDEGRVRAVRNIIEDGLDWPCEVYRDFSESNLGCRTRVASGLNAAFEMFEKAIILEDDCLPEPGFFLFCAELLERYQNDHEVMHIAGTNLAANKATEKFSYRFSRHPWIWGWATWRRAWKQYDFEMRSWDERIDQLRSSFASKWEAQYWISSYNHARRDLKKANTWGFPWMYTCRSLQALSIMPAVNLVENIGFGPDSTHTDSRMSHLSIKSVQADLQIRHPRRRCVNRYQDELITRTYCGKTGMTENLKSWIRTLH